MRTALVICWFLGGGGLGVQLVLALVAALSRALAHPGRPSLLSGNALFFSAVLSPVISLVALVIIALAGLGWLLQAPGPERVFFSRSLLAGAGLLGLSLVWLVLQARLFGGGIIPH